MRKLTTKSKNATVWHKIFLILADVLSVVVAILFAYLITVEDRGFSAGLLGWTLGNIVCTIALFGFFGMYAVVFSSVGIIDALKLSLAVVWYDGAESDFRGLDAEGVYQYRHGARLRRVALLCRRHGTFFQTHRRRDEILSVGRTFAEKTGDDRRRRKRGTHPHQGDAHVG